MASHGPCHGARYCTKGRLRSVGIPLAIIFMACSNWKSYKNLQQKRIDEQKPHHIIGEPRNEDGDTGSILDVDADVATYPNYMIDTKKNPASRGDTNNSWDNSGSTDSRNRKSSKLHGPSLIVHIGPAKTGTTTLQKSSRNFTDVLALDGYIYAGKFGIQKQREAIQDIFDATNTNDCIFHTEEASLRSHSHINRSTDADADADGRVPKSRDESCSKKARGVISMMNEYFKHNTSVIISDEAYSINSETQSKSQREYEALRAVFQDWDLSFVVTYRRYAEWMLSALKQKHSWQCVGEKSNWKGRCQTPISFIKNNWKTGKHSNSTSSSSTNMYRNIDETMPVIQSANITVTILNFHEEQHITSSFYCDIIPNTPNTCKHTIDINRSGEKSAENMRAIMASSCSTIIYEAAKIGLSGIDKGKQTRHEATSDCIEFMNTNNITHADLPLHCPRRGRMETLLKKSLAFEEKMVPEFFASERGEVEHRRSFWRMVEERKEFCHVNTNELLEGKVSWEEVLASLKRNTKSPL